MTLSEKIAYIIYGKLHFLFNRQGKVYTGDLVKKWKKRK